MDTYDAATFQELRPTLLAAALRVLGNRWDAEDAVQETFVRWSMTDRPQVRDPRAYLTTIVTRMARVWAASREATIDPASVSDHLPSDGVGPAEAIELHDEVFAATKRLLERLSPQERTALVLRDVFRLPFEDIAATLGVSAVNTRQIVSRARRRLTTPVGRYVASRQDLATVLDQFLAAVHSGDLAGLSHALMRGAARRPALEALVLENTPWRTEEPKCA